MILYRDHVEALEVVAVVVQWGATSAVEAMK